MPDAPFIPSPQTIADYPVLPELTPNTTSLAARAARPGVLKRLEDDSPLEGELHPLIPSPHTLADYPALRELTPHTTYPADRAGRRVVLKRLEDDCLLEGELHPLIRDRLSRVRELAHVGVANLLAVELDGDAAYLV